MASRNPTDGSRVVGADPAYMEAMHHDWREDPNSVPDSWRHFFEGMAFAGRLSLPGDEGNVPESSSQFSVAELVRAYRREGHLAAQVDPLDLTPRRLDLLELSRWGFREEDLEREFDGTIVSSGFSVMALGDIRQLVHETYCRSIGVEYMHIQDDSVRLWLRQEMESCRNDPNYSNERRLEILGGLTDAELFEKFTHSRYPGQKRFSLEGGETLIPSLQALIEAAAKSGVAEIVLGMAHRGRLNVLANVMGMSYEMIFSEFEGNFLPDSVQGDGDVKYHKGYSSQWRAKNGEVVHLSLTANPSHLEAVNPVVEGRVRAKQRQRGDTERRSSVLPLLIHGDAAFSGQGVVAETLNLSQLPGYRTGGTVHLVINNQIGFTTLPEEARSSAYCTDVAKAVEAPIFHVNGDDPEAVVYATELALRFRQRFGRDVVVDMVCYRRHGHNEGDDPAFTQPVLYAQIKDRPSVRKLYIDRLLEGKGLTNEQVAQMAEEFRARLESAHETAKRDNVELEVQAFEGVWRGFDGPFKHETVDTHVEQDALMTIGRSLCTAPEGFNLNPKVGRQLKRRLDTFESTNTVDWPFAELLAFGSLLTEKTPVRLSGQDSGRGTFSQRHSVWQDFKSQQPYVPLNHLQPDQAKFCVYNSLLSEAAVLGFEYGYSLSEPNMLLMWEAQFGDFVNGAQVIIDQFITGAESKWQRDSGLVMLLPHGYEGQGPEHSNAYVERFLQGCAEMNAQVCIPSTPAQYFHLLRRQVRRDIRLPLIVFTPKSLLRHKRVISSVSELANGQFSEVLKDPHPPKKARRLVFCTGKVFWDLLEYREAQKIDDVALIRVEQLYPLQQETLREIADEHSEATEVIWTQEEPQNRGAWTHLFPQLLELFPDRLVGYVGREASASPSTGSLKRHRQEQEQLVKETLTGKIGKESDESRRQSTGGRRVGYRRSFDRVV